MDEVPPHDRLRPGALVRIRGERWRVCARPDALDALVLDVSGCDRANAGVRAAFVIAAEQIAALPERRDPRPVRPSRWRRIVRHELAAAVPGPDALRAAAPAALTILPFQLEPALAITRGLGHRLLIADEVGLGKTIQAGLIVAELLHRRDDGRALIVTPASLRDQWCDELRARFNLHVTRLDAQEVTRDAAAAPPGTNPWTLHRLIVTSIDFVKRPEVLTALEALVWDALVLDEAHQLCGTSDRASAAGTLAARARIVVSLTATPHSGDDAAFERLCTLGRIGPSPLLAFRRTRGDVGLAATRRTTWLAVRLSPAERRLHERLLEYARLVWRQPRERRQGAHLALVVLVKRACSSPASLLCSLERRQALLRADAPTRETFQSGLPFLEPADGDEEPDTMLGAPGMDDQGREIALVAELIQLARAATGDERKLAALRRLVHRTQEPVIVFTEYRDTLEHVRAHLLRPAAQGSSFPVHAVVHGGLTASERHDALNRFRSGQARVLLATDAASEGLNLHQRCRCVVQIELPWSPIRLEQRTGRVDRLGQRHRVHALHLVAAGTQEEQTVARLLRRMLRAGTAFGSSHPQDNGREITAAVIGATGADVAPAPAAALRTRLSTPDLRAAADAEADRLRLARRLVEHSRPHEDGRPVVTRIRRVRTRRCVWSFRVTLAGADDRPMCRLLLGIEAALAHCEPVTLDRLLRDGPQDELRRAAVRTLASVREAQRQIQRSARAARRREEEIAARLRDSRARLAPRQGSLFDRRTERLSEAQAAVLAEALRRCEARLTRLGAEEQAAVRDTDLAFAVLLG